MRPVSSTALARSRVLLALVLSGCASVPPHGGPAPASDAPSRYEAAIRDAAIVSAAKLRPLAMLPASGPVAAAEWVSPSRVPCAALAESCPLPVADEYRYWVVLADEMKAKCHAWGLNGDALRQRMEELLGLPPNQPPQYRKSVLLLLQVSAQDLARPCLGVRPNEAGPGAVCTLHRSDPDALHQGAGASMVGQQMIDSDIVGDRIPGYPFTRLGYTYDWNERSQDHYGLSEFVLRPGAAATVTAETSIDQFCNRP